MRITWFGGRCFRIKFSDKDLVLFPEEAIPDVKSAALLDGAIQVDGASNKLFFPLAETPVAPNSGRLIDVMDDPERYLSGKGAFVMDAPPDERLVIRDLSVEGSNDVGEWQEGAVVLAVGTFALCAAILYENAIQSSRQLIFAVVEPEALDIDVLAAQAGKMRIQLAEIGLAIEL